MFFQNTFLRDLLMVDENLPPREKAVLFLLEGIALALAFVGVERAEAGSSLPVVFACFIASFLASYSGFKWPQIKPRIAVGFSSGLERIASNYRYRVFAVLLVAFGVSCYLSIYLHSLRSDLQTYVMPRTLTNKQADGLREYLSHHEAHAVTVKVNPLDQEASEYAAQIFNALKRTDWDVTFSTALADPNTLNNGLSLCQVGFNSKPNDPKHDPSELLSQAFQTAHIPVNGSGAIGAGEYKVYVLVGQRPLVIREQSSLSGLRAWLIRMTY